MKRRSAHVATVLLSYGISSALIACGWGVGGGVGSGRRVRGFVQGWFWTKLRPAPQVASTTTTPTRRAQDDATTDSTWETKGAAIIKTFPFETSQSEIDSYFMQLALEEARRASDQFDEVPIGALVVRSYRNTCAENSTMIAAALNNGKQQISPSLLEFEILAASGNRVETWHDASAHAELLALRTASRRISNWRLSSSSSRGSNCNTDSDATPTTHTSTTLYSTLEPCPMCYSALHAFRVPRLVYGAPDHRLGAVQTYIQLFSGTSDCCSSSSNSSNDHVTVAAAAAAPKTTTMMGLAPHPFHTMDSVIGGVHAEESSRLLREFFQLKRKQQKVERRPVSSSAASRVPVERKLPPKLVSTDNDGIALESSKGWRRLRQLLQFTWAWFERRQKG